MQSPIRSTPPSLSDAGSASSVRVPWWHPVILGAMAGGLGWGIRGQYGHETGAMIAGVLVGLALSMRMAGALGVLQVARAVAWCTAAIGIGGAMTYGQTIGLTQDAALVGNHAAWRWGMTGLALKGGLWIGFAGVFLGMGLGRTRYRTAELAGLLATLLLLFFVGTYLFNSPFDPAHRLLPRIYFSADWRWLPDAELKPRREVWGGLLLAWVALTGYLAVIRKDGLAWRLGAWGFLGGALGFPLGQCLQSYHAWHPELYRTGLWTTLDPVMNWWNMMETTFGAVMGGTLGFGLWYHRGRMASPTPCPPGGAVGDGAQEGKSISKAVEWMLAGSHAVLILAGEFTEWPILSGYTELSLVMIVLPVLMIHRGRWWPFLLPLPLTLLPIAVKTAREMIGRENPWSPAWSGLIFGVLPMAVTLTMAIRWARGLDPRAPSMGYTRPALLLTVGTYLFLNGAFFRFPWPWLPWTTRTPNALLFMICAVGLTLAALWIPGQKASVPPKPIPADP